MEAISGENTPKETTLETGSSKNSQQQDRSSSSGNLNSSRNSQQPDRSSSSGNLNSSKNSQQQDRPSFSPTLALLTGDGSKQASLLLQKTNLQRLSKENPKAPIPWQIYKQRKQNCRLRKNQNREIDENSQFDRFMKVNLYRGIGRLSETEMKLIDN